jgi:hypothetical protein
VVEAAVGIRLGCLERIPESDDLEQPEGQQDDCDDVKQQLDTGLHGDVGIDEPEHDPDGHQCNDQVNERHRETPEG